MKQKIFFAIKYAVLLSYLLATFCLLYLSAVPGEESAEQSNYVADVINEKTKINVAVKPQSLEIKAVKGGGAVAVPSTVTVGDSLTLCAVFTPSDASDKSVLWSTDDDAVAETDDNGVIVFKNAGSVTVTAKSKNHDVSDSKAFTVLEPEKFIGLANLPHGTVDKNTGKRTFCKGDKFYVRIVDNYVETPALVCSDNLSFITPYPNLPYLALVTAEETGESFVKSTVEKDGVTYESASFSFEVLGTDDAAGAEKLEFVKFTDVLITNKMTVFEAARVPSDAKVNLSWESSDTDVVEVDANGLVYAKGNGVAEITVKDSVSGLEITRTVKSVLNFYEVESVVATGLDKPALTNGDSAVIKRNAEAKVYVVFSANSTFRDARFVSSDTSVAEIDSNGNIKAKKTGETVISISCYDGDALGSGYFSTFTLRVERQYLSDIIYDYYTVVRKVLGHFGAFALLGAIASVTYCLYIAKKPKALITCAAAGAITATASELIQMAAVSRGPQFTDFLINFSGYMLATLSFYAVLFAARAVKKRKRKTKEKENAEKS